MKEGRADPPPASAGENYRERGKPEPFNPELITGRSLEPNLNLDQP